MFATGQPRSHLNEKAIDFDDEQAEKRDLSLGTFVGNGQPESSDMVRHGLKY